VVGTAVYSADGVKLGTVKLIVFTPAPPPEEPAPTASPEPAPATP